MCLGGLQVGELVRIACGRDTEGVYREQDGLAEVWINDCGGGPHSPCMIVAISGSSIVL
jgi:hypothetical protein